MIPLYLFLVIEKRFKIELGIVSTACLHQIRKMKVNGQNCLANRSLAIIQTQIGVNYLKELTYMPLKQFILEILFQRLFFLIV